MMRLELPKLESCGTPGCYVTPVAFEEEQEQLAAVLPSGAVEGVKFLAEKYQFDFVEPVLELKTVAELSEFISANGEGLMETTWLLHKYFVRATSEEGAFRHAEQHTLLALRKLVGGARSLAGEFAERTVEFSLITHRNAIDLVRSIKKFHSVKLSEEAQAHSAEFCGLFNVAATIHAFAASALLRAMTSEYFPSSEIVGALLVWLEESAAITFRAARAALDLRLECEENQAGGELTLRRDHDDEDVELLDADLA